MVHRVLSYYQNVLYQECLSSFPSMKRRPYPFNAVFNSKFKPKQERDGISMNDRDKELIKGALSVFPFMVEYAVNAGWEKCSWTRSH